MKGSWYWFANTFLILFAAIVLNGVQCSLWYLLFGAFPPPLMWLLVLVYVAVTRPLLEATILTYALTLVNAAFTVFPFEALLVYSLTLMVVLMLIRERVFWGGSAYFMLMMGVASLTAPILYWFASRWFDQNPVFIPQIFDWLISGLLSMLISIPIYHVFHLLDAVVRQEGHAEGRIGFR